MSAQQRRKAEQRASFYRQGREQVTQPGARATQRRTRAPQASR